MMNLATSAFSRALEGGTEFSRTLNSCLQYELCTHVTMIKHAYAHSDDYKYYKDHHLQRSPAGRVLLSKQFLCEYMCNNNVQ